MTRKTWINRTVFAAAGVALLTTALPLAAQQAGPRGPGAANGDPEQRIEMFFATFDADADGTVTEAEIEAGALARFVEADTNGDGVLSVEELVAAAEARRLEEQRRKVEGMVERLDANGDGVLSQEEMDEGRQASRMERMFERLDADGDGAITREEMAEARFMKHGKPGERGQHGHRNN